MNNKTSPSVLMKSEVEPTDLLDYQTANGTEQRRPEEDLLTRMEKHYTDARRCVELEVEPLTHTLPLLRLTGYDGKTYLPLSESRDWKMGVSTIKCFECLN